MSKSVVPAAAVAHAKRLVENKKFAKRHEAQQPAQDEPRAADHKDEAANAVHQDAQPQSLSMSDATLGGFSFSGALADAASTAASLTVATSAQEDGGYSDADNGSDGSGTILLVGAVGLVGAGIAVLASGGNGNGDDGNGNANRAPTVSAPTQAVTTDEDVVVTGKVSATDPDGDALTYAVTTAAGKGTVEIDASGNFKYTPNADVNGSDSFVVTVKDPAGLSVTQTVNVTITPVNDAPFPLEDNTSAFNAQAGVATEFIISFDDIDNDPDDLTVTITEGPEHGTISEDGTHYIANADYVGTDTFTYEVSDGAGGKYTQTVTVTVGEGEPGEVDGTLNLDNRGNANTVVTLGDGGEPAGDVDLTTGAFLLETDPTVNTNVIIKGFGDDDRIVLKNFTAESIDDVYSFTTGVGANGADDLVIEFSNTADGTVDFITLEDVITAATPIYSYDSAVAALGGSDFMTIA